MPSDTEILDWLSAELPEIETRATPDYICTDGTVVVVTTELGREYAGEDLREACGYAIEAERDGESTSRDEAGGE